MSMHSPPLADLIFDARPASLSTGMTVQRVLPYAKQRMVGPFVFLDHAGPTELAREAAGAADVLPHPHIGLSTLSYLLSGEVTHRDSLGVHQLIRAGDVNWMTAGKGIAHSERFDTPGAFGPPGLELLQSWVALPDELEECDPSFDTYGVDALPVSDEAGVRMRLVAGEAWGARSTVRVHSPLFYVHVELQPGAHTALPDNHDERAIYVVRGEIEVGGERFHRGQMLVFKGRREVRLRATEHAIVMLLGGEPVGHRYIWWNFVSSSRERIEQAKADWTAGRIILPPNDDKEFVPLPA